MSVKGDLYIFYSDVEAMDSSSPSSKKDGYSGRSMRSWYSHWSVLILIFISSQSSTREWTRDTLMQHSAVKCLNLCIAKSLPFVILQAAFYV